MKIKKIAIFEISGAGKTTLARELSRILKLPIVFLDRIFWAENWRERAPEKVEKEIKNFSDSKKIVRLSSPHETRKFLRNFSKTF